MWEAAELIDAAFVDVKFGKLELVLAYLLTFSTQMIVKLESVVTAFIAIFAIVCSDNVTCSFQNLRILIDWWPQLICFRHV